MLLGLKKYLLFILFSISFSNVKGFTSLNFSSDSIACNIDSVLILEPLCNGQCTAEISVFAQGTGTLFFQWPGLPGVDTSFVSGACAGTYSVIITDSTGCVDTANFVVSQPDPILFNFDVVNSTCPGGCSGVITVLPLDTISYSYQWPGFISTGPVLTSICQGSYSVILTDPAGCTATATATVSYDPPFQLSISSTLASCLSSCDGSATVTANGIPPFTYQWESGPIQTSQTAINLCQGIYVVNVTDSTGCVVTDSVVIGLLPPPVITNSYTAPTCFGGCNGSAEVFVGTPGNYLFEWNTSPAQDSTTAIGLCSGTYAVLVTDVNSGCVFVDSVLVEDPAPPVISFIVTPTNCENICNGTASVQSSAPAPLTYLWQTGNTTANDSLLCPGIYAVTITDSLGCAVTGSVNVESVELFFNSSISTCNAICDGTAEVLLPPGSWQVNWNTVPIQSTTLATGLCSGEYQVAINDTSGCVLIDSVTIGEGQPFNVICSSVPVSCPGACDGVGFALVQGSGTYSYSWNTIPVAITDSVSQLCEGQYLLTVTDTTGCFVIDTINVGGPQAPQFSYLSEPNSCFNICDASTVISSNLPGSYIYQWQTFPVQFGSSATGLCPGYTVVEINNGNGCSYVDSVLIFGPDQIFIALNNLDATCFNACDGFANCLAFGGTPGYTYEWSNGFTTPQVLNLCEGTYTVTVTDSKGCTNFNTTVIDQPDSISVQFVVTDASCALCSDGNVVASVTGGVPGYSYFWSPGGTSDSSLTNVLPGIYNLCVADANLCFHCMDVEVSFLNSLYSGGDDGIQSVVFPNPFSGDAVIKIFNSNLTNDGKMSVVFYDVLGKQINSIEAFQTSYRNTEIEFQIRSSNTAPGIYFYSIKNSLNVIGNGRFVINSKW